MRLDAECQAPEPRSASIVRQCVCTPTDRWWAARNRSGRRRCSGGRAVEAWGTVRSSARPAAFPSPVCRRRLPAHRRYDGRVSVGDAGTGSTRRVADLSAPFWIAHRGMANVYPENTLEAYRSTVALGVEVVEPDCWLTRDGGLVCLHDATVDRTTDGSGNTDELTVPGAGLLHVDAGNWFAAAWPNTLRVPTFAEVLEELDGHVVLCPEAKNAGAGRAIVDRLIECGRLDGAIVQSFTLGRAPPRGCRRRGCDGADRDIRCTIRPRCALRVSVTWVCRRRCRPVSCPRPSQPVSTWRHGLSTAAWTQSRGWPPAPSDCFPTTRYTWPGARRCSRPTRSGSAPTTTAIWPAPSPATGERSWRPARGATRTAARPTRVRCKAGAAPSAAAADRFDLTFTVCIDGAADSDGWAGAFISAADDRSFDDADQYQPGLGGYHILLRQSGSLELHIVNQGIATLASLRGDAAARAGHSRDPAHRRCRHPGHRHPRWCRPDRSRLRGRRGASGRVLPSGPPGRRRPLL